MNKKNASKQLDELEKRLFVDDGLTVARVVDETIEEIDQSALRLMFLLGRQYVALSNGALRITSLCPDKYRVESLASVIEWNTHFLHFGRALESIESLLELVNIIRDLVRDQPTDESAEQYIQSLKEKK